MSDSKHPATFDRTQKEFTERSEAELARGDALRSTLQDTLPEFGRKWDVHLPVFLTAPAVARILWLDFVYRQALNVPGRFVEFGSQWGASLNTLLMLKLIHEPWNAGRELVAFSTFDEGFTTVAAQDGNTARPGDYGVSAGWKSQLERALEAHAERSPLGAARNFRIMDGDVRETLPRWLQENPDALISHAHFDMDVYEPTCAALRLCLPRMPRGAVLIFDELNCPAFPGETRAVDEVLGIAGLSLRKTPFQPYSAYCVIE